MNRAYTLPFPLSSIGLLMAMTLNLPAASVLIDFGRTDNKTTTHGGSTYNNVAINLLENNAVGTHTINDLDTSLALMTTTNAGSGWSISLSKPNSGGTGQTGTAGGGEYAGTFPAAVSSFAPTALSDGLFVNNNATLIVTISGLNNSFKYNLLTYAARTNSLTPSPAEAHTLTVGTATTGSASQAVQVTSATSNSTVAPYWEGITPVGGQIQFQVDAVGGTSGRINALNFLSLTQVPEPSAALLGGLGLLVLLRRRRA